MSRLGARLAEGRTAEVFVWDDGRVIKLYRPGWPLRAADDEHRIAAYIHSLGAAAPKADGVADVDGRRGVIYERRPGRTMLQTLGRQPAYLLRAAPLFAELQAAIHAASAPELGPLRSRLEARIAGAPGLEAGLRRRTLELLEQLPDGDALCHGDFHPDNILIAQAGAVVIDWADAARGHPLADVARTTLLFRIGELPPGTPGRRAIDLLRALFYRLYTRRYFRQNPSVDPRQLPRWMAPVAAARLVEQIPGEREKLVALIRAGCARAEVAGP